MGVAEVAADPDNPWAWIGLAGDIVDFIVPFVGGIGETVRAINSSKKIVAAADEIHDTKRTIDTLEATVKVHGNSLSTKKPAVGYALRSIDTNDIMKYGETTRGTKRYTNKFYRENNVYMDILESGTKREMHTWQHLKIIEYFNTYGELPPMNKSFW